MTAEKLPNIVEMSRSEYIALYSVYTEARLIRAKARPVSQLEANVPIDNINKLAAAVKEFEAVDSTEADRHRKQRAEAMPHDTAEDLKGPGRGGSWDY